MDDMSRVIEPKSDQINADDLTTGPITVTIVGVKVKPGTEQPVSVDFGDSKKVFRPCKTMSKLMCYVWKSNDSQSFVGKSITLYRDPEVTWGGLKVSGIRISHMSHIDEVVTVALLESSKKRKIFTVTPLSNTQAARTPPKSTKPPTPPENHPSADVDPSLSDWADLIDHDIDRAVTIDDVKAAINGAMEDARWAPLKAADSARATGLKSKAGGKIGAMEGGV